MAGQHTGQVQPSVDLEEHRSVGGVNAKAVTSYVFSGGSLVPQVPGSAGFITSAYDYVAMTYPDDVTDVFTFKSGGSGGTTVATVTIVYVDSTKVTMTSVAKT